MERLQQRDGHRRHPVADDDRGLVGLVGRGSVGVAAEAVPGAREVRRHHPGQDLGAGQRPGGEPGAVADDREVLRDAGHALAGEEGLARRGRRQVLDREVGQGRLRTVPEQRGPDQQQGATGPAVRAQALGQVVVDGGALRHHDGPVPAQVGGRRDHVELHAELLQRPDGADVARAGVVAERGVDDHGDLADDPSAVEERLARPDVPVGRADQLVHRPRRHSARVQHVTDAAGQTVAQHLAGLVAQGRLGLEGGVVPPALVEAPGVAEDGQPERADEAGHVGQERVAPAAGGQPLDLDVPDELPFLGQSGLRPAVVPGALDGVRGEGLLHHRGVAGHVALGHEVGVAVPVVLVGRVQALAAHPVHGPAARAGLVPAHVDEDPVDRGEAAQYLVQLVGEVVGVGAGHVEDVPGRLEGGGAPAGELQVLAVRDPLGVLPGRVLVDLEGQIDRRADAHGVQGLDLFGEQVEIGGEAGVAFRPVGAVVEMAVVALGEDGHAVDVGFLEGPGEGHRVEVPPHVGDVGAGVEVQVHGAAREALRVVSVHITLSHGMDLTEERAGRPGGSRRELRNTLSAQ